MKKLKILFFLVFLGCSSGSQNLPHGGRLPTSASNIWYINYVNVQTECGVLSVTVHHVSPYIEAKPLAGDELNDIVVYRQLGPGHAYPVATELPQVGEILLMVGQYYKQEIYLWVRVASPIETDEGTLYVALDGVGYPGMSGSPAFNSRGEYVGSMSAGHVSGMGYSGLSFLTRVDLVNQAIDRACRA